MYQILHNKSSGVDVDKFDFIVRDTKKFGIENQGFDYDVLMNNVRLLQNNICYKNTDSFLICDLFACRYRLFKEFYLHRVSKGIDLMLTDVFKLADPVYNFREYLNDTSKYYKLNDSVMEEIFYSKSVQLEPAREIIRRIKKRDLYRYATEITRYPDNNDYDKVLCINEQEIANYGTGIKPEDIKIMKVTLDCGKGELDPFDYVKFYKNNKLINLDRTDVSNILPNRFKELTVRLYVKDPDKLVEARESFKRYCSEKLAEKPNNYEKNGNRSAKKLTFK